MLVLENSVTQCRHHDANGPACVALQLDDLVRAVNSSQSVTNTGAQQILQNELRYYDRPNQTTSAWLDSAKIFKKLIISYIPQRYYK